VFVARRALKDNEKYGYRRGGLNTRLIRDAFVADRQKGKIMDSSIRDADFRPLSAREKNNA